MLLRFIGSRGRYFRGLNGEAVDKWPIKGEARPILVFTSESALSMATCLLCLRSYQLCASKSATETDFPF